jgi:prophage tail gpP-like protein
MSGASNGASAPQPNNDLTIISNGVKLGGWKSIRVTRGIERMPSDFDISLTERYPGQASQVSIRPGDACKVMIGNDLVLVGYIDRLMPSFSATSHEVRIQGRGMCEDLVDCSLSGDNLNGMQIVTSSLLDLATKLAAPYGITVSSLTGDNVPVRTKGSTVPLQFNAVLTESPYEVIERVARFAHVLPYEGTDGNLILANVGAGKMASGFAQGTNVQTAAVAFTMDERFSIYLPTLMSTNFYGQEGIGGIVYQPAYDQGVSQRTRPDGKPRFRQRIIVSEQWDYDVPLSQERAQWEAARRWGRSQAVRLTCDSWRDSAGALWTPNFFAPIDLPALKLQQIGQPWIISEVSFNRDAQRGTTADLVLMPKEAFTLEPTILQPFLWDPNTAPVQHGAANVPGGAPT